MAVLWALTYYEVEMNLLISSLLGIGILEWIELHVGFSKIILWAWEKFLFISLAGMFDIAVR